MSLSTIDGWSVSCFAAAEQMPSAAIEGLRDYEYRFESVAIDHPRARRAILELPMKSGVWRYFGVVHWSDGTDLGELDHRARAGEDLSASLEAGIFCSLRNAQCSVCHTHHLVAVADRGMPVVTTERQRAHTFSTTCPTCDNTSYLRHAELFAGG